MKINFHCIRYKNTNIFELKILIKKAYNTKESPPFNVLEIFGKIFEIYVFTMENSMEKLLWIFFQSESHPVREGSISKRKTRAVPRSGTVSV